MKKTIRFYFVAITCGLFLFCACGAVRADLFERVKLRAGVCAVLGLPENGESAIVRLASHPKVTVYVQCADAAEVDRVRQHAEKAGLLGVRIFVDRGGPSRIHLAGNLADVVVVGQEAFSSGREYLRVLRPGGRVIFGDGQLEKLAPPGVDDWSHPHHGPDNNPQSTDQLARAPYLTQFVADPKFSPMPEMTVIAGGRVFKAMGHLAHRPNQNEMLNTLLCTSAYNGVVLWRRPLREGFMIHRNTMVATETRLYLGDDQSCKLIDAESGEVTDEIRLPDGMADGTTWKWMAISDGVLYALVGGEEIRPKTRRAGTWAMGGWLWDMWEGHDYANPETNFGFGRTVVAIDLSTRDVLWFHREKEYLDSRGVCMSEGRFFFYSPGKFLGSLDAKSGTELWRVDAPELLAAIGDDNRAQHWNRGYSTQTYIKANADQLFFAGPQREQLVAVNAHDGGLLWQREDGNMQLVLRSDAIYAASSAGPGARLEYESGKELDPLPRRRACTRATGSIDSIFYRTPGGTVRYETTTLKSKHIAPMRPPCQDGVLVAHGLLYWGPWMCACQLSLYGHIALGPAGDFQDKMLDPKGRLVTSSGDVRQIAPLFEDPGDWPVYRRDDLRSGYSPVQVARETRKSWTFSVGAGGEATPPVVVGGFVFFGDRSGVVHALDVNTGDVRWKFHTSGAVFASPAVDRGRVYVGSADGRVYALEAATGRELWRYRVAPVERWIPVYGKLMSTWPVTGGVLVHDGVVYAAAGISHYDGTHVVALDGVTGEVKWHNGTSGKLSEKVDSGISLQGNLYRRGNELRFLAGGVYQVARYDLATGKCLNEPWEEVRSRFKTALYAFYPQYTQYQSLTQTFGDGKSLKYFATYHGLKHSDLMFLGPLVPGDKEVDPREPGRNDLVEEGPEREVLWSIPGQRYQSLVVTPGALIAAGEVGEDQSGPYFLSSIALKDGAQIWTEKLSAPAVRGGTAVDRYGKVIVALQNGEVHCFVGSSAGK